MRSGSSTANSAHRFRAVPTQRAGTFHSIRLFVTLQNSQVHAQAVQGDRRQHQYRRGDVSRRPDQRRECLVAIRVERRREHSIARVELKRHLATLPQRPLQAQNLLTQRCAAQLNGQLSSLVVAGRDALPAEPGGWLMSSLALMADETPVQEWITDTFKKNLSHER